MWLKIGENGRHTFSFVQPDTVTRWHREGFRLFWKWKSRWQKPGRQPVDSELRQLIGEMSRANPLWGAPRIHGELLKLGFSVSQRTVGKYIVGPPRSRRSQTWKSFLHNHLNQMVSMDFFTLPTLTFGLLYVCIVLDHHRRKVLHFQITKAPSAIWAAQQLREAFAFASPPKYLLRDRDGIYGLEFRARASALGVEEVLIAPRCPWQSPYVERLIGSIRRECLDHVIVMNARQLKLLLQSYFDYYHHSRSHLALDKDAPQPRAVQGVADGKIVALPQAWGLHHRYERRAA